MKILFVKTNFCSTYEITIDLGVASISAVLKKNKHDTSYFLVTDPNSLKKLFNRINTFNPEVIGLSSTESTRQAINKIVIILKKKYPKKFFICGGVDVILNPEIYLKNKKIDAICLGEGEYTMTNFLENFSKGGNNYKYTKGFWVRDGNNIIKNNKEETIKDLNKLPQPDREVFFNENLLFNPWVGEGKKRTIEFMFSRGCYYNCSYCSNHALRSIYGQNYVRFRSPLKAIEEIKNTVNKYKPEYIVFHDDSFTVNKPWLDIFLKKYSQEINIPFKCNTRVDLCSKQVFSKLKKAGCECIQLGIESGDSYIRNTILNRHMSDALIIKAFKLAKKYKIKTAAFVMIGIPTETPKKFIKTMKLVAKTNADIYRLSVLQPYQGTAIYNYCQRFNLIEKRSKSFIERQETVLNLPNFKKKHIDYFYKNFDFLVEKYREVIINKHSLTKKIIFDLYCTGPVLAKLLNFFKL